MIELDQGGARASSAVRVPIPADLAEWVSAATVHRGGTRDWKIVADDAPHLIFSRTGPGNSGPGRLTLVGARSRAIEADLSRRHLTAIVRLRPGALQAVAGLPGAELADRGLPWGDATSDRISRARLAEVSEPRLLHAMLALVRDRLARAGHPRIDWRVRALLAAEVHPAPVGTAHRISGVSTRTLHRSVREAVGLSPSTTVRIRRLHRALLHAVRDGRADSRLAFRHGYADQSHWIRECRALMGETPHDFLRRRHA
jgi:AraC-like DNA-binding protein